MPQCLWVVRGAAFRQLGAGQGNICAGGLRTLRPRMASQEPKLSHSAPLTSVLLTQAHEAQPAKTRRGDGKPPPAVRAHGCGEAAPPNSWPHRTDASGGVKVPARPESVQGPS